MIVLVVLLGALALLTVCIEAECIARVVLRYGRRYFVFPPGLRVRVHPDPQALPELPPAARFVVNQEGERGDELPDSTEGLYRVLVGGGSMPEGFFLDQDATWPGALQRLLETPARLEQLGASKVHVGCIARSGVGSDGLDLMFSRALPHYPRLQLIVTLVGVSDVMRWLEQGTPDVLAPIATGDVFRCHPEGPFGWRPRQLALTELVARGRRRWLKPLEVYDNAGRWLLRARVMRAKATTVYTSMPDPAPMLAHFEHHFRRALLMAQAHADRVLVIRQPWLNKEYSAEEAAHMWHGAVGQPWREDVKTYYSFDVFSRLMTALDERAAAVADALEVEELDLKPTLEPNLNTYYDGFHLTEAGAMQVAQAVMAAILRQRLPRRQEEPGAAQVMDAPETEPARKAS